MGKINWNARKVTGTKMQAWYDSTTYEVPFTGDYDYSKVWSALHSRVAGPFLSLGAISVARPGVLSVETLYKIGD